MLAGVLTVLLIVLLLVIMVLSTKASIDAGNGDVEGCHKYATITAVLSGITVLLFAVGGGYLVYNARGSLAARASAVSKAARR